MRYLFLTCFLCIYSCFWSQDSLHIYFNTGSSKIRSFYFDRIANLPVKYDLSSADSLHFIGFADSTGRADSNKRLSLRRAEQVYDRVKRQLPKDLPYTIMAKGEGTKPVDSLNRRVDIVIFFPSSSSGGDPNKAGGAEIVEVEDKCYAVDQTAMLLIHSRIVKEKKKEAVFLETEAFNYFSDHKLYCVKERDKAGKAVLQRVKWQEKTTGVLWWKKKRLVATVPKYGFDRSFLVEIVEPPCDDCTQRELGKDSAVITTRFFCIDGFLMSNIEAKVKFFGRGSVKLRAPREYVNPDERYRTEYQSVDWDTKRAKRKQAYYYTTLKLENNYIPEIGKTCFTSRCVKVRSYDRGYGLRCRGVYGGFGLNLKLAIEPGAFYHNDTLTAFLSGGLLFNSDNFVSTVQAGINSHAGLYTFGRIQYHFFPFPFRSLSFSGWNPPAGDDPILIYGELFAGLEVKRSYNKDYLSFNEGNLHLGILRVNVEKSAFVPRIYLYGGIARDFTNRINKGFYPFVQCGLAIKIADIHIWR